jgi:hypothetical protein
VNRSQKLTVLTAGRGVGVVVVTISQKFRPVGLGKKKGTLDVREKPKDSIMLRTGRAGGRQGGRGCFDGGGPLPEASLPAPTATESLSSSKVTFRAQRVRRKAGAHAHSKMLFLFPLNFWSLGKEKNRERHEREFDRILG